LSCEGIKPKVIAVVIERKGAKRVTLTHYLMILDREFKHPFGGEACNNQVVSVKEYNEEFYRLNIRDGQKENDDEKTTRYINGLR
jgi:hypothetical protein